jgi:transcriptional regulator with XRE-family HTH domain
MKKGRVEREPLAVLLREVEVALGGVQKNAAQRMGLSRRTLQRYTERSSTPTPKRAVAILQRLTDLDASLFNRLADGLAVPAHQRPRPPAAYSVPRMGDPAEHTAMTLMLYTAAEAHGIPPAAARHFAVALLDHATQRGLDVPTARAIAMASLKSREGLAR